MKGRQFGFRMYVFIRRPNEIRTVEMAVYTLPVAVPAMSVMRCGAFGTDHNVVAAFKNLVTDGAGLVKIVHSVISRFFQVYTLLL
jgi:hypothetical protein